MKILAPYVEMLYGARFDRKTLDYIKNENFEIIENSFIYQDTIKILVLQKNKLS